ncbi:hypothetical protein [Hydrogenophaga sp.]|uniref:hypothetical protein n=1 Tax=Hydrogenophaga sp. TaxID=1904254 RepID=UPI0025B98D2F|nr:hypothetical protein [Hydrogenophaga sp.]MBT9463040.1 hypothetical protein [Hydrogenophaga sp.]
MTEKKLSALECASVEEVVCQATRKDQPGSESPPCALLDPHAPLATVPPSPVVPEEGGTALPSPGVEDESADPVGDGHSDAELAAEQPKRERPPQPREGPSRR